MARMYIFLDISEFRPDFCLLRTTGCRFDGQRSARLGPCTLVLSSSCQWVTRRRLKVFCRGEPEAA